LLLLRPQAVVLAKQLDDQGVVLLTNKRHWVTSYLKRMKSMYRSQARL
jgi:hypothetical protein